MNTREDINKILIVISAFLISSIAYSKAFKAKKKNGPTMTAEYPKADYPNADYPQASYPSQDYGSTTHDDCRSSHEEDEDSVRKGYE